MAGDLDCVVLAAGSSTRMERWKMTLPCGEVTVVECTVRSALEACARVVLVTGFRAEELERLFAGERRVHPVRNRRYEEGMFSSIKAGAAEVASGAFFLALGDMPLVSPAVYRTLAAHRTAAAVIPKYRGKKGHPLLLSEEAGRSIASFPARATLRDVLAGLTTLTVPVEDRHVLCDIDVPADYRALMRPAGEASGAGGAGGAGGTGDAGGTGGPGGPGGAR